MWCQRERDIRSPVPILVAAFFSDLLLHGQSQIDIFAILLPCSNYCFSRSSLTIKDNHRWTLLVYLFWLLLFRSSLTRKTITERLFFYSFYSPLFGSSLNNLWLLTLSYRLVLTPEFAFLIRTCCEFRQACRRPRGNRWAKALCRPYHLETKITISDCRHLGRMNKCLNVEQKKLSEYWEFRRRVPIISAAISATVDVALSSCGFAWTWRHIDDLVHFLFIWQDLWTGDIAKGSQGINLNACSRGPVNFAFWSLSKAYVCRSFGSVIVAFPHQYSGSIIPQQISTSLKNENRSRRYYS